MDRSTALLLMFFVIGCIALERLGRRIILGQRAKRMPQIGELWVIPSDDGSPWPKPGTGPVKITDIKKGWVRYDICGYGYDDRLKLDSFVRMYRPVDEYPEQAPARRI